MIPVDEAIQMWLSVLSVLDTEDVPLRESYGRVAAAPVVFPQDTPAFSNSSMDGFAIRHEDLSLGSLKVAGEVAAGQVCNVELQPGEAIRIMTGAPIPSGADTVVRVEDVNETRDQIIIVKPPKPGESIRPAGDDAKQGAIIVKEGSVIGAGELASLASAGILRLRAYRRPRVALLTTGDEVVPPEETPAPGQIRDSSLILLSRLYQRRGAVLSHASHVGDGLNQTRSWLESVFNPSQAQPADLAVTTGGVSMGRYDLVRAALQEAGFSEIFWRVRQKPGKPILTAYREGRQNAYACGLPGNPISALVGSLLYVIPALDRLEGRKTPSLPWLRAKLMESPVEAGTRTAYITARLTSSRGGVEVCPIPRQGSHRLSTLIGVNALIRVESQTRIEVGEEVPVLLWGDLQAGG
ncbi:MAG: molybdopterin molybdotransferase MoeA [Candidatus Eisenbacteria bacterium]|uniref:Molybdopterin molybdenumtransferase n=1 Tax=Eiseniibacteriota bacterium TaxID=2212470 RepID=A0A948W5I8_UNCEI|nr:molybdopterin molybdotransferase MoeA [Candidatus Eisenbacteria bacterium]MBU1951011.1 molybdopterin molybdotransferase MoeA [Candidatus Eisenbacteria bacterium]MBU2690040.1 molybdopterin molybdotransferase MoeA [Candidatus Eisenbacteria bacterium]